jgi:CHAD domain-containing protein
MSSSLQRYFSHRVKNLFNSLHEFELSGNESHLHDFRVEMKKLKAIIKFLQAIYPKQKLKKAKNYLQNIFQDAGEVREYQVLLNWLQKNDFKKLEENYFHQQRMKELIVAFHNKSQHYKADLKEVVNQCSKLIENTNIILAEQYVVQLKAKIEKSLHKQTDTNDWHELRKLIKQWMYAINWIEKEEQIIADGSFSFYNKLQEVIGIWHDREVIKETITQKQIHLSSDIEIQKDYTKALDKLFNSLKYREKQVEEMLVKPELINT